MLHLLCERFVDRVYSVDDIRKQAPLINRCISLTSCISGHSISESPMIEYKALFIGYNKALRSEIMKLHKESKSWSSISLADIATEISRLSEIPNSQRDPKSDMFVNSMMKEAKTTYCTIKNHIRNTVHEMSLIGLFDLQTQFDECEGWNNEYPNERKAYKEHLVIPGQGVLPLERLKARMDSLCIYIQGETIKYVTTLHAKNQEKGSEVNTLKKEMLHIPQFLKWMLKAQVHAICVAMIRLSYMLESIEAELQDMIDEFNAWKFILCAMALHPRVGKGSFLGAVGADVVKLILDGV